MSGATLEAYLRSFAATGGGERKAVAGTVLRLANAALKLQVTLAEGGVDFRRAPGLEAKNKSGDAQHALDLHADELFLDAAREAGIAHFASEERPGAMVLNETGTLGLAIDPLDGSSNIETNLSIGTIFSILPALDTADATFAQKGRAQLAAGFFIYGPQLSLALTLGHGTQIFTFSRRLGTFVEANAGIVVPNRGKVFAINMSNYRHWDEAVRLFIDDCLKGSEGVLERDFNMRWNAAMIAEAFRILRQGGVYLYPRDDRRGYHNGRLRLVYEANPIALLMEQAGGRATDGIEAILDIPPESLHQHIPLVFGSADDVTTIARYQVAPSAIGARHPLFGQRGLFRT